MYVQIRILKSSDLNYCLLTSFAIHAIAATRNITFTTRHPEALHWVEIISGFQEECDKVQLAYNNQAAGRPKNLLK